jgi:hypothetical protein
VNSVDRIDAMGQGFGLNSEMVTLLLQISDDDAKSIKKAVADTLEK